MIMQPAQWRPSPKHCLQSKRGQWRLKRGARLRWCTHSTVNSCAPTGMQYTNCMALQRRWNSTHSSTCITPLLGSGPRQMGSSKKARTRVRMTSNMDRPQHSLSLVSRSPSRAMAICWWRQAKLAWTHKFSGKHLKTMGPAVPVGYRGALPGEPCAGPCIWLPDASSSHRGVRPLWEEQTIPSSFTPTGAPTWWQASEGRRLPLTWTLGRMFWKGAACSKSQTSSCDWDTRSRQKPASDNWTRAFCWLVSCTRLCSLSRQNSRALPTSLRFWKQTVFSSAYSTMSFSWWWKNSKIPVKRHEMFTVASISWFYLTA